MSQSIKGPFAYTCCYRKTVAFLLRASGAAFIVSNLQVHYTRFE